MRAIVGLWIGLVLLGLFLGCGTREGTGKRLDGAGSTFVDPVMQEWASAYYKEKGVAVNYQAKGSGAGIRMLTGREVHFGCSDAPLNEEQLADCKEKGGEVLHIPLCMGAIVPAYNLEGITDLVFSGPVLMNIYLGKITKWNDPELAKINPDKKLPDLNIAVAYRSDASGSTYILTDYFSKVDKATWTPGRSTTIKFPVGTGSKGNDGVAGFVKQTSGAIGYVELIYAMKTGIPYGKMINASGKTILAEMKSVTAAAANADIPEDLRYSITNAPGEEAYPISGTVWAVVYARQPDRADALRNFLTWITHEGQKYTDKLHYAPLPDSLVKKIDAQLAKISK